MNDVVKHAKHAASEVEDVQGRADTRRLPINRVGIKDINHPVRVKDRVLATISVRYAATAVPLRTAVEQFLPKMRDVATKIEREFALL